MPSPRTASVRTIGGFHPSCGPSESTWRTSFSIVFAIGWSILLIAITSGISMIPAFSAWIESPEPGISASTTVSAIESTPTSLCPVPTVSRKTTSLPAASSTSSACSVVSARPPRWPRVPIERMNTSGSRKWSVRRMRSPSSAPCVNGLDGSTEMTPTVSSRCAREADERRDERRLADAGRAGDPDRVRVAGLRVEVGDDRVRERVAVLDERDRAGERAVVAVADACRERLARPVTAAGHDGDATRPAGGRARRRAADPARQRRAPRSRPAAEQRRGDPYVQRGPTNSVSAPAATIAMPEQRVVGADDQRERATAQPVRPCSAGRSGRSSGTPARCRSRRPPSRAAATQMFGAIAAPRMPAAQGRKASG